MAPDKEITLTAEELEELKDTIKFRVKVVLQLKALNNIPEKVRDLNTGFSLLKMKVSILMWGVPIILFIFGIVIAVLSKF